MNLSIRTEPYSDQKPGTSGLRKKVAIFRQPHYAENFIQAILDTQCAGPGHSLVLGGDGRFLNRETIATVIRMAAANGIARLILGRSGLLSPPAASHLIRKYGATGGIILSASHNPGGPEGDFGIKFNTANGGPAPEKITAAIAARTRELSEYRVVEAPDVPLESTGTHRLDGMTVEILDPVTE